MSSRDGFARADIDTNLLHDPKVLALARRLRDHGRTAAALILWESAVLASWKARARLTVAESAPAWWLDDPDDLVADLQAVGLIDDEGRIPAHAFDGWTSRARKASEDAASAARARWHGSSSSEPDAAAVPSHSGRNAQPPGLPAGRTTEPAGRQSLLARGRETRRPNGRDADAERHRRDAIAGIRNGTISGSIASRAIADYAIAPEELAT